MKVMKYFIPLCVLVLKGPHISEWITSSNSKDCQCLVKGFAVIFPLMHDSHIPKLLDFILGNNPP
jgi:hypothetical protein